MRIQHLDHGHIPGVVSLLSSTMPWAPTTEHDISQRLRNCPEGQCVVHDQTGKVIGYGFMIRTRAGLINGEWYQDTGHGVGENHLDHGNVSYVCSTVWDHESPAAVRTILRWYRTTAEQWLTKQIHGFSRVPSLLAHGEILQPDAVHDLVLDGQDPLTHLYWKLGFEPAVPQPNYSVLDRESAGYGMLMVSSV